MGGGTRRGRPPAAHQLRAGHSTDSRAPGRDQVPRRNRGSRTRTRTGHSTRTSRSSDPTSVCPSQKLSCRMTCSEDGQSVGPKRVSQRRTSASGSPPPTVMVQFKWRSSIAVQATQAPPSGPPTNVPVGQSLATELHPTAMRRKTHKRTASTVGVHDRPTQAFASGPTRRSLPGARRRSGLGPTGAILGRAIPPVERAARADDTPPQSQGGRPEGE